MYTKNDVLSKIENFRYYSISMKPDCEAEFNSLIDDFIPSISNYFDADRSSFKTPLNEMQLYLYSDLMKRGTEYENPVDMQMSTNFPVAYNDLRKLFYSFPFLTVTDSQFYNAWVFEESETGTGLVPVSNSLLDLWKDDLNKSISDELGQLQSFNSWLSFAGSGAGMVMLWENLGKVLKSPKKDDLCKSIFIDKKLLEAIKVLNLPCYTPLIYR